MNLESISAELNFRQMLQGVGIKIPVYQLATVANRWGKLLPLAIAMLLALHQPASGEDSFKTSLQPAFRQCCVKCHGEKEDTEGDINLLALKSGDDLKGNPDLIEDLIHVLELEEMPPESEPELSPEKRRQLVRQLRELLRAAIVARKTTPPTPIRRMNRFQYNNAVQDLFELKVVVFSLPERMLRDYKYFDPASRKMPENLKAGSRPLGKSQMIEPRLAGVSSFPQDLRAEHGFDNRGDHLSLSPLLLESFLKLSRSIVESPDFNAKTCGSWDSLFAPPTEDGDWESEIRKRLDQFLSQAFRRPVDDAVLERYVAHVMGRLDSGDSFTAAMKTAASAVLASPRFLYLYDRSILIDNEPVNDFELASRLSFFLWGSIPDQTLLELAAAGRLRDPEILGQQVDRMLDDVRLKRFCDSFPSQWLQLERIISSVPDPQQFPKFYFAKFRASMHMMLEPLLLFETVLIEDRSILDLIDPDFSYRSNLLEAWYRGESSKKNPPAAIPFRRVAVTDRREGGVITNAAVMTMTSSPTRTQPITRGAWLAAVIFNDPPAPPPADVPPLPDEVEVEEEHLTLRERFEAHRTRTECAQCHIQIDPLGFALENYGPTGIWRDTYENGRDVDMAGVLFRKHEFSSVLEFKDVILAEKDRFARAFAKHLLSFALGREVSAADSLALDEIVSKTKESDYRFRRLIKQIVLSEPFLANRF